MIAEAVLALAAHLPARDYNDDDLRAVAGAIAKVVTESRRPIFGSRELDAAVMLATAYQEARFVRDAIGDGGAALCYAQLHGAPKLVLEDVYECARGAYQHIRWSVASCDIPLAQYIGGCSRRLARTLARNRMSLAWHLLAETQKRREFRSPDHLRRDMVENAETTGREIGGPTTYVGVEVDRVGLRRSHTRGQQALYVEYDSGAPDQHASVDSPALALSGLSPSLEKGCLYGLSNIVPDPCDIPRRLRRPRVSIRRRTELDVSAAHVVGWGYA